MFPPDQVYVIAGIGILYSLCSTFVMNKLVDRKKVMEIQEESKQLQKELAEASKSNDAKKLEEVNKKYEQFMPKMFKVQLEQMKPLIVLLPALAILTPWLRVSYKQFVIKLPFYLPIFIQNFGNFPNWRNTFGSVGWFWLCVLAFGFGAYLIKAGYDMLDKKYGLAKRLGVDRIKFPRLPFGKKNEAKINAQSAAPAAQGNPAVLNASPQDGGQTKK